MAWGIGANDVSNAMGTAVGSKSISIRQAIIIAAIFEFLGALLAGGEVANTIKENIIDTSSLINNQDVICIGMLSSLLSASCWLLIASVLGWPVSTTHTIVGAIVGFGITNIGFNAINWETFFSILLGWLFSPLIGAALSFGLFTTIRKFIFEQPEPYKASTKVVPFYIFLCIFIVFMITASKIHNVGIVLTNNQSLLTSFAVALAAAIIGYFIIKSPAYSFADKKKSSYHNVEKTFSVLMIFTACAMAFAHGSNDVANAIGPVSAIVAIAEQRNNSVSIVPIWVLLTGATGIITGLVTYGHKVIATVGTKITLLTPSRGFCATLSAAVTVLLASSTGLPISTTHTLVGGILGIGLARGVHALNLNVIRSIFASWVITFPAGAILSTIFFKFLTWIFSRFA